MKITIEELENPRGIFASSFGSFMKEERNLTLGGRTKTGQPYS